MPSNEADRGLRTRRLRNAVLWLVGIGLAAGLLYFLYANADKYLALLRVSASGVLTLFLLSLAFPALNGLINTYLFRDLGANLSQREGFLLAASATLVNQLPVPGGIFTRAIYLKYKYALSYTKYFSAQLALFICSFSVYGLLGLCVLLYWLIFGHMPVPPILTAVFAAMAASLVVFWLPLDRIKLPERVRRWVREALDGWQLFSRNPMLLLQLLGLQTVLLGCLAARYWIAFHMLSQNVTPSQVILFASASVLTQLVSFAPGGLGVREAIVGAVATALGFDLAVSVAAVGLDRLVVTMIIVLTGGVSTVILGRQINEVSVNPGESRG